MAGNPDYTVKLLIENGLLTKEQAEKARGEAEKSQGILSTLDMVVKLGFVSRDEVTAVLAQSYGMEVLDLDGYDIPQAVIESLSPEVVLHYNIVPVGRHGDTLTIAMSDPTDVETLDALRYLLGCDVEAVVSSQDQIDKVIAAFYKKPSDSVEGMLENMGTSGQLDVVDEAAAVDPAMADDDTPIIRLVHMIIADAYKMKASDIHLEPMEKRYRIRYRVDGALREVDAPPKYLQANLTSRLKIMSKMDITEKRIPLDGRIQLQVGENVNIDLRVSSVPTTHGESIVMRILDKASIQLDIPKLGFYADDLELVEKIINMPDGIFLVTGPTGSGKTTSLYAFLNTINTTSRKIITVEDPVEYQLSGINQVQVDKSVDMTFANALRSMLRQAPNIIMVGEIRDFETAEIAINAALTGHMVFSTLHTNDAPGAITRLVDMGVKPFLVATAVRAVMAQRLLRRICSHCKAEYVPSYEEKRMLGFTDEYLSTHKFYKGTGCEYCSGTGYKGRIGIYEIFLVTEAISKLIFDNKPAGVIRELARQNGMRSLRDDALRKAEAGVSTLAEVICVTLMDEV
ncbi:MAG: type IV-A pilus assembly ATPase PilB [Victivallaceae bacterium]|nr:type IV-A pilus assembly ATPase PilB [Victivallaceae bacterium]